MPVDALRPVRAGACAYSRAAAGSWIEHGPTTTNRRGSSRSRIRAHGLPAADRRTPRRPAAAAAPLDLLGRRQQLAREDVDVLQAFFHRVCRIRAGRVRVDRARYLTQRGGGDSLLRRMATPPAGARGRPRPARAASPEQFLVERAPVRLERLDQLPVTPRVVHVPAVAELVDHQVAHDLRPLEHQADVQADRARASSSCPSACAGGAAVMRE